MALVVELTPAEEEAVHERAREAGVSPSQFIARLLAEAHVTAPPAPPTAVESVKRLLAQWQREDGTPVIEPPPPPPGMTPTEALFRQWDEEDARMTEAERQAEKELWEAFQQGINEERAANEERKIF
jgi:hypothetical protein